MGVLENRGVALKMPQGLKVWLKICLAFFLINFAPHAGATRIRQIGSYESYLQNRASPNDLITGNDAYGLHEQGDDRTPSVEGSDDSNPAILPQKNSDDLYGSLSCNYEVDLQTTQDCGFTPGGMPIFQVTITNTCLDCDFFDIHIDCGDFSSPVLVRPHTFRKLSSGNCLLNNGGPLVAQNTVAFAYESTYAFPMTVRRALVSCKG